MSNKTYEIQIDDGIAETDSTYISVIDPYQYAGEDEDYLADIVVELKESGDWALRVREGDYRIAEIDGETCSTREDGVQRTVAHLESVLPECETFRPSA